MENFLLGKSQNPNESFNGTFWERILKNTFVALPNLEFGVYDGVTLQYQNGSFSINL